MQDGLTTSARRLRQLSTEWPESCYERFNFHRSESLQELLSVVLSDQAPSVVVLAGEPGIGRGYLCRAAQHHAKTQGRSIGLWNLDLHGFEPEGQNPLADFHGQLSSREETEATREPEAMGLGQAKLFGQASEWAAALLSVLWQFEDPTGEFAELLSRPGHTKEHPRDDPETLRRLLFALTETQKLLVHVRDSDELPSSLRRWLIHQAERSPERLVLMISCPLEGVTEKVAASCSKPPMRLDLHALGQVELRESLDRFLAPNALSDDLVRSLAESSRGRPGLVANWLADLVEAGTLATGPQGQWRLRGESSEAASEGGTVQGFSSDLFAEAGRRIAQQPPELRKILQEVLTLAALGGAYVPLPAIYMHLQLDEESGDAVTDFVDDVLDDELGWLADCGFLHPSFPGLNVYAFTNSLIPQIILDQTPEFEREMSAASFLGFLGQRIRPGKRGIARWFLEIASHLGKDKQQPYQDQLSWWCTRSGAAALRDDIRADLGRGAVKPEEVWRTVAGAEYWPPYRRMALLEAFRDFMLGSEEAGNLSREQLIGVRILESQLYYSLGQYRESLNSCRLAKPLVEGERHIEGQVLNQKGLSALALGKVDSAQKDFKSAHELFGLLLGPEHPDTLSSQSNLASTYRDQGNYEEARKLHEEEWEICLRVLGPEHPNTLSSQANLASTYHAQGSYEKARDHHQGVWEILRRVLGPEHPHTLTSQANLASTYRAQGNHEKAGELNQAVWEALRRVLGPEHPETLIGRDILELSLQKIAVQKRQAS